MAGATGADGITPRKRRAEFLPRSALMVVSYRAFDGGTRREEISHARAVYGRECDSDRRPCCPPGAGRPSGGGSGSRLCDIPSVQGAAGTGRASRPQWNLAGLHHRKLGHPGSRGASRSSSRADGRVRRRASRPGDRGRERDPLPAVGAGQEKRKPRETNDRGREQRSEVARHGRSRTQVLPAGRAARDLHAVSVSDRAGTRRSTS